MVTRVVKAKFLLACDNPKTGLASPKGRLRPGVPKVRYFKIRLGRSNIFKFSKTGQRFGKKIFLKKFFCYFRHFPPLNYLLIFKLGNSVIRYSKKTATP